jgi:GAF domain-containing protein
MADNEREGNVVHAFVSLVDTLLDDFDIVELLTRLTEQCAQLLDVATGGLLLADAHDGLHLMAATSRLTHELEMFQLQIDQGPCLDCYHTGAPVIVPDLRAEMHRWPLFVPAAIDGGFASVHAVPMRTAHTVLGALGLFGTTTGALNDHDLEVAQALAHVASVAILQNHELALSEVQPRLQSALISRVVVDQATGLLYERLHLGMDESFTRLRAYAHKTGRHLTDVARDLVTDREARDDIVRAIAASAHSVTAAR